jgi:hypothetical protein
VATPAQPYLIPRGVASTTSGHCQRYQLPYWRLQCHQQSFFPPTIRLWNELPAEAVSASTVYMPSRPAYQQHSIRCI